MSIDAHARELEDEEIAARVCQGEIRLFEVIMRRYNQRLFRTARAIVRSDAEAEDIVQEAYLQAFAHLAGFEGRARFSTWLVKIVIHEAWRRRRRQRKEQDEVNLDSDTAPTGSPYSGTPEQVAATGELARILERTVDALPDDFRAVFMLRVVERLDVATTATCLEIPEATVKTRLHRARELLRRELEEQTDGAVLQVHPFLGERCNRMVRSVLARLEGEAP